jgi:hypothetical protein
MSTTLALVRVDRIFSFGCISSIVRYEKQEGDIELQKLGDRIVVLKKLEQSHAEVCRRLRQDIGYYINQKQQLIAFIEVFKLKHIFLVS